MINTKTAIKILLYLSIFCMGFLSGATFVLISNSSIQLNPKYFYLPEQKYQQTILDWGVYAVKCPGTITVGGSVQPLIIACNTGKFVEDIIYIKP